MKAGDLRFPMIPVPLEHNTSPALSTSKSSTKRPKSAHGLQDVHGWEDYASRTGNAGHGLLQSCAAAGRRVQVYMGKVHQMGWALHFTCVDMPDRAAPSAMYHMGVRDLK